MTAIKSLSLVRSSLLHQRHQFFSAQYAISRGINRKHARQPLALSITSRSPFHLQSKPSSTCRPSKICDQTQRRPVSSFQPTTLKSAYQNTDVPSNPPLHSSATSWIPALLVCLATSATLYFVFPARTEKDDLNIAQFEDKLADSQSDSVVDYSIMTGEAHPGRPGTLTAEEEEKLREFWIAVLHVFGVLDHKETSSPPEPSASITKADTSLSLKKQKKKRLGLFRKKDSDETDSTKSAASSTHHSTDTDDKYGQTKEFQDALANQSPESLRATFWSMVKHDHPDALLLRFLRARKWDVEKALVMMVSTMSWRSTEMHVDDDIMLNGELGALEDSQSSDPAKKKLGEDFLTQMRMGKSFLHGLDKDSRPMCFVRARLHRQGEQSEASLERYTVFVIESARMILSPPVDTACVVFDMTGFSMANMDYAPVKFMIKCFEANYPESLGVVLIHKAPWIFQGVWKIIRGWLDPVVAAKVNFTNNNSEMEAFVPASRIIHELAGSEDWTYNYIEPVPGENDKMKDTESRDKLLKNREGIVDEFEKATLEWINGEGDLESFKKKRHEIANKLKDDYWVLDPYIRARSYYDRVGLINPGGKLEFYKEKPVEVVAPPNGAQKVETSADDID